MSDRDCENCKHKINGMCEKWKCEFEAKEILPSMEELLARAEAKGRADAIEEFVAEFKKRTSMENDLIDMIAKQIGEKNES